MKSMVIGAAGFAGGYMTDYLSEVLHHEVVATKLPTDNYINTNPKVQVEDLDLENPIAVFQLLNETRPDFICNFASQNSIGFTWGNPGIAVDTNIKGSINLLEAARQLERSPRILLIGSGEEYGLNNSRIKEDTVLHPGNIYGATKACQNMLASIYVRAYHMDIVMARIFNDIGPGQSANFAASNFCRQIADIEKGLQEPVIYVGNLSSQRTFTDIRDAVRAYALLGQKGISGEIYNVAGNEVHTIQDMLDILLSLAKCGITVKVDPDRLRPVDVPYLAADIRKIKEAVGWQAEIPFEQTLADMLDYWRHR